jgi:hypothetical protein
MLGRGARSAATRRAGRLQNEKTIGYTRVHMIILERGGSGADRSRVPRSG